MATDAQNPLAATTAVVTGGASGIGLATARAFAEVGAHVVVCDIDATALENAASQLPGNCTYVYGDVSSWQDCQTMASAAGATGSPVTSLINSAATFLARGENATADDWDASLGVNVKGTAMMASAIAPLLRMSAQAAIVNVASVSAYIAQPERWTYNTTKGALVALTRCQALDLAVDGIRVNSVSPGTIWTPELDRISGGDRANAEPGFARQHMLGRVGEPPEVAAVILFLCGPGASFITGADVLVDGGYVAMGHDDPGRRYNRY
jgi:NAD(P)-dependent dehydrogenase (short-subunit alcohol dehydrogenase family)